MKTIALATLALIFYAGISDSALADSATLWRKHEISFTSDRDYDNPLYEVREFSLVFTSPTGQEKRVEGFWDGGRSWKARFLPDEPGEWSWQSTCSDSDNGGLHGRSGTFSCVRGDEHLELFQRGAVKPAPGKYHLSYDDGTPFFWMGCTAWNGAMKATESGWDDYLRDRRDRRYNLIQFVTTQWRGGDSNRDGDLAFTGSGRIEVNPQFFQKLDQRVDRINEFGLVASPVLLWALPSVTGRELSPGYYLPVDEAAKLARYIIARYQGNHVIWSLGGDGRYFGHFEARWKAIGKQVFDGIDHAPATLHPHGRSYIGDLYAGEDWYGIMGYQSSHSYAQPTVDFINREEIARSWDKIRPMPFINMEPIYENIHDHQTPENVRNAIWWSLFATPVAGITYGANGIWPWVEQDGGPILNHREAPWTVSWRNSLELPVSKEMEHLYTFWDRFDWWDLFPAKQLLVTQPGDEQFDRFVGVLANPDASQILVYVPQNDTVTLRNPRQLTYDAQWFNPVQDRYSAAQLRASDSLLTATKTGNTGQVLVLTQRQP